MFADLLVASTVICVLCMALLFLVAHMLDKFGLLHDGSDRVIAKAAGALGFLLLLDLIGWAWFFDHPGV